MPVRPVHHRRDRKASCQAHNRRLYVRSCAQIDEPAGICNPARSVTGPRACPKAPDTPPPRRLPASAAAPPSLGFRWSVRPEFLRQAGGSAGLSMGEHEARHIDRALMMRNHHRRENRGRDLRSRGTHACRASCAPSTGSFRAGTPLAAPHAQMCRCRPWRDLSGRDRIRKTQLPNISRGSSQERYWPRTRRSSSCHGQADALRAPAAHRPG